MKTVVLKLLLTPTVITGATLVTRRWGPTVGGWAIAALPFQSAAIVLLVTLDHGTRFGANAATGALTGAIAQAAFAAAYTRLGRTGWPSSLAFATVAFGISAAVTTSLSLRATLPIPLLPLFACAIASLAACLSILPHYGGRSERLRSTPRWDLPMRAAVATTAVTSLTLVAPTIGAGVAGLLGTFPVGITVMATFAHAQQGRAAAIGVLRGLMLGLFAFSVFFLALASLLPLTGPAPAFASAAVASTATHLLLLLCYRGRLAMAGRPATATAGRDSDPRSTG